MAKQKKEVKKCPVPFVPPFAYELTGKDFENDCRESDMKIKRCMLAIRYFFNEDSKRWELVKKPREVRHDG